MDEASELLALQEICASRSRLLRQPLLVVRLATNQDGLRGFRV